MKRSNQSGNRNHQQHTHDATLKNKDSPINTDNNGRQENKRSGDGEMHSGIPCKQAKVLPAGADPLSILALSDEENGN